MPGSQTVTLEVAGDVQLERELRRFTERARNMRPVWNHLTNDFLRIERRQFASEGAYGAGGWAPLSPIYREWKERAYPGRPIMVLSNALKRSLTRKPLGVQRYTETSMELGTSVPYARHHQRGNPRHNAFGKIVNLPARPVVALTEDDRVRWVKDVQRWIVTGKLT